MIYESQSDKGTKFSICSKTLKVEGRITTEGWGRFRSKLRKEENSHIILRGLDQIYYGWSVTQKRGRLETFSKMVVELGQDGFEMLALVGFLASDFDFASFPSKVENFAKLKKNKDVFESFVLLRQTTNISFDELYKTIEENKDKMDYFKMPSTLALFHYAYSYGLLENLLSCFTSFSHFKNACISYTENEFLSFNELEKIVNFIKYYSYLHLKMPTKIPKNIISEEIKIRNQYEIFVRSNKSGAYESIAKLFKEDFIIPKFKDFTVDFLESIPDLALEGEELNHCVFSYLRKILDLNTNIISLQRNGKRVGTIEIKGKRIIQKKAHSNQPLDDETLTYLQIVAKANNLEII